MEQETDHTSKPEALYRERQDKYQKQQQEFDAKANGVSRLRLLVSLGGTALSAFLFWQGHRLAAFLTLSAVVVIFTFLVIRHRSWKEKRDFAQVLLKINIISLERLAGGWPSFPDTGSEFADERHPYTEDLDIFGPNSLFQYINTTRTYFGRKRLKEALSQPLKKADEIRAHQKAVLELAEKPDWRQNLEASGMSVAGEDPSLLIRWAAAENSLYRHPAVVFVCRALPCLTILLFTAACFHEISYVLPLLFLFLQAGLLFWRRKDMAGSFGIANRYKETVKTYARMLSLLQSEPFSSPLMNELQSSLLSRQGSSAREQIKKLESAVDKTYMRFSQFYFLYNIITLWDFQCQIALEAWKEKSGRFLTKWLHALGEAESLASLSLIAFDNPHWAMPDISLQGSGFTASDLAHPLLGGKRVGNDLTITHPGEIFLITGSNMSGKSTLLRTAGINLVLAYAGAPVSARSFSCVPMDIYTSMRINDDLSSSTSSFYAELLRIKTILDAAKKKERPLFFLLDEVFRGTNSLDRHTGARYLLKMLSKSGALGLVSTHDLELGELASEKGSKIKNFHFREEYRDGALHFDYRLYPGVSTTKNALFLMKMAGIEIEE